MRFHAKHEKQKGVRIFDVSTKKKLCRLAALEVRYLLFSPEYISRRASNACCLTLAAEIVSCSERPK
jgi:hypothetical protein